jgi:hypothetical protein
MWELLWDIITEYGEKLRKNNKSQIMIYPWCINSRKKIWLHKGRSCIDVIFTIKWMRKEENVI